MSDDITVFLAVLPLLLMIVMILKLKMPIHLATLTTLILVVGICAFWLHTPVWTIGASVLYGALKGIWPITIVIFMAIYSYNLMVANARMDILRGFLSGLSNDRRIVSLIIIWCFGTFLEGAAGFGTSVAIPISIMMALGFNPMRAAVAALVADTLSTTFGAVGIPISILASTVGLSETGISSTLMMQLGVFDLLLPFAVIYILEGSVTAFYGVALAAFVCGLATLAAQWIVASYVGPQLVDFAGALAGLITLIVASKFTINRVPYLYQIRKDSAREDEIAKPKRMAVLEAGAIYILSFVFILLCSPLFPSIRAAALAIGSSVPFTLNDGRVLTFVIDWVATPGMLIFFATIAGGLLQKTPPAVFINTFLSTTQQLRASMIAISSIVAMATLMDTSGLLNIVAQPLIANAGDFYLFISPLIGALGTFVTGSVTNANVLFGKLQLTAATELHLDTTFIVAANAAGATAKMISPQSISIALSAASMPGRDAELLGSTLRWFFFYMLLVEAMIATVYFFLFA